MLKIISLLKSAVNNILKKRDMAEIVPQNFHPLIAAKQQ